MSTSSRTGTRSIIHLQRLLCQGTILATAIQPFSSSAFVLRTAGASCSPRIYQQTTPSVVAPRVARRYHTLQQMSPSSNGGDKSYIDKLALILVNSKQEQLVARSHGRSVFYTPGGKRETGESDEQALNRECLEELAVDISKATRTPARIESYGTFEAQAYGKPEGTMVRMTCYRISPRDAEIELEKLVEASSEVEELKWIDSSFDKEKLTVTGIMILEDLKEKGLIR
ncbi:hypothetical protein ACHAWF_016483 [Thalassiosira exigua]